MKTLILCDCQADFVTGSMSVKKRGKEAVEHTKVWINRNKEDLDKVIFKVVVNTIDDPSFKRNGGDLPQYCIAWTPGFLVEPTVLKLLWRLKIPYYVCMQWNKVAEKINPDNEIVIGGMNGNTTVKEAVDYFHNSYPVSLLWPGTWFFQHDEKLFRYLREHSTGIFEIPKRDKKKDLFCQRTKR